MGNFLTFLRRYQGNRMILGHNKCAELYNELLKSIIIKLIHISFIKDLHINLSNQCIHLLLVS